MFLKKDNTIEYITSNNNNNNNNNIDNFSSEIKILNNNSQNRRKLQRLNNVNSVDDTSIIDNNSIKMNKNKKYDKLSVQDDSPEIVNKKKYLSRVKNSLIGTNNSSDPTPWKQKDAKQNFFLSSHENNDIDINTKRQTNKKSIFFNSSQKELYSNKDNFSNNGSLKFSNEMRMSSDWCSQDDFDDKETHRCLNCNRKNKLYQLICIKKTINAHLIRKNAFKFLKKLLRFTFGSLISLTVCFSFIIVIYFLRRTMNIVEMIEYSNSANLSSNSNISSFKIATTEFGRKNTISCNFCYSLVWMNTSCLIFIYPIFFLIHLLRCKNYEPPVCNTPRQTNYTLKSKMFNKPRASSSELDLKAKTNEKKKYTIKEILLDSLKIFRFSHKVENSKKLLRRKWTFKLFTFTFIWICTYYMLIRSIDIIYMSDFIVLYSLNFSLVYMIEWTLLEHQFIPLRVNYFLLFHQFNPHTTSRLLKNLKMLSRFFEDKMERIFLNVSRIKAKHCYLNKVKFILNENLSQQNFIELNSKILF
jgi:hypothetical protein